MFYHLHSMLNRNICNLFHWGEDFQFDCNHIHLLKLNLKMSNWQSKTESMMIEFSSDSKAQNLKYLKGTNPIERLFFNSSALKMRVISKGGTWKNSGMFLLHNF